MEKLVRLSQWNKPGIAKGTLYKWHHLNKFPGLFVKLGSAVFIDTNVLDNIIEAGRMK